MSDLDNAILAINQSADKTTNTATFLDDLGTFDKDSNVTNPNNGQTVPSIAKRIDEIIGDQIDEINETAAQVAEDAQEIADAADLFEEQREQFDATFTAQFTYAKIGNISDFVGDTLTDAEKLNSYQYPDDSDDWYGPIQSQTFPITIPADPTVSGSGWSLVNGLTSDSLSVYTDIVYKASGGNSAVENMIAGIPITAKVGDLCSASGTEFIRTSVSLPPVKGDFKPVSKVLNIVSFGYVGDYRLPDGTVNPSPTDNYQAWLDAISFAKPEDMIIVPYGMPGYVSTNSTISIPKGVMVKQYSPQYCDNDTHNFTLWDYNGEGQQFGDFRFDLRPTKNNPSWSNTGEIGLTIRNCQEIDCDIKSLWGFYTGLRLIGENNKGVAHCTFNLGLMFDNKIDISIYGTGVEGYVNQNTFNQGQFITSSSMNQATGKYAVVINHEGTYKHNSNVFYNPSFEKKSDAGQDNVAILMIAGRNNNFFNVRAEMKNGKTVMRVEGTSERNVATVLFSNGINGLVNAGTGSNNIVSNVYDQPYDFEVFNIGDFSQLIREPKVGESTSFGLDMWRSASLSPSYWDGGSKFSIEGKLSVMASGNAVGKLVNTFETKKLTGFASFSGDTTGRILCIPFDKDMNAITDLTDFKTINSQSISSEGAAFTGGAFTFGVNTSGGGYIVEVTEDCKYLWVGAYAKGSAAKCNQLSVSTVKAAGSGLISISPGYSSNGIPTTLDLPLGSFFHRINRTQAQSRGWSFDGSVWFED